MQPGFIQNINDATARNEARSESLNNAVGSRLEKTELTGRQLNGITPAFTVIFRGYSTPYDNWGGDYFSFIKGAVWNGLTEIVEDPAHASPYWYADDGYVLVNSTNTHWWLEINLDSGDEAWCLCNGVSFPSTPTIYTTATDYAIRQLWEFEVDPALNNRIGNIISRHPGGDVFISTGGGGGGDVDIEYSTTTHVCRFSTDGGTNWTEIFTAVP